MTRIERTFVNKMFLQQFLERQRYISHFRTEQRESYSYSQNRKTIKLHCWCSFSSHGGKRFFARNIAEEVLTQWIFILPPISFGESSIILREHEGKAAFRERQMTKTRSDRHNSCCETLFYCWQVVLEWGRNTFLFLVFTNNAHNRQWLGTDVGRHYQIYSDYATPQAKQGEIFATGEIKDDTGNLYSVISWARWYLWPHGVSELEALTRSHCSVTQTCFNCESKCLWYEIYCAGKGKREQGQPSLPNFDRGMGKYQRSISKRNRIFIFIFYSMPAVHTAIFFDVS